MAANIKTSPTERVHHDSMPHTRVLELLLSSMPKLQKQHVYIPYLRKLKYVASGPVQGTAGNVFNIPLYAIRFENAAVNSFLAIFSKIVACVTTGIMRIYQYTMRIHFSLCLDLDF